MRDVVYLPSEQPVGRADVAASAGRIHRWLGYTKTNRRGATVLALAAITREGARRILARALEAEIGAYTPGGRG